MVIPNRLPLLLLSLLIGMTFLIQCGRHTPGTVPNDSPTGASTPACSDAIPCESGECVDGVCHETAGPLPCTDTDDCPEGEYCHFPAGTSFDPASTGECTPFCQSDNDCFIGQQCLDGICYTNYDCTPGNNNCDCPPGEVCNSQLNSCNAPPSTCYFVEQCPCDWLCGPGNTCLNPGNLGVCSVDGDCNAVPGCENDNCTCNEGSCQPAGACTSAADCPPATYCQNGVCQPAQGCTSNQDCFPYGLICDDGHCVNAPPCAEDTDCPESEWCNTRFNPPGCFPDEFGGCVRDDQCLAGQYCNLFSGSCQSGCRSSIDCQGQCPGQSACSCNALHECVGESLQGDNCEENTQCPGGTICAPENQDDINCLGEDLLGGLLGTCNKSCLGVCDILVHQISPQCPSGETCQIPGGIMAALFDLILGSGGNQSSTVGVCYP